ncbi:MAG: DUF11 domain-containing protein, partial [Coriobacteriales bacterium]|nr:DUF11 domain-containing protein [Coriobacteriales bacterium]
GSLLIDTLPAGATYTVNYQIVAEAGTLANTVTATDGGGGGGGNTDTDTNTDVHAGSLEITKKPAVGQPGIVKMGDPVTYTITIRNLGTQATDALTDVSIVENMPGTWSDALGFDLGAALQPGDNSLLIDTILPGRTCTVNYTVIAGEGTIANTVTGTSDGGGGGDTDTNTDITGGVLDISKAPATGQPLLVETGDPVTYTITIKNLGTATTLLDVLISEAAGMPGGTWSNAVGFTLPGSDANGELTADSFIIPSVDAGATLTVDYTVDAGEGTLVNTVTGTDGGGGGPNTDTGTNTDIHAGILDVHKAPAAGQALTVETGDPVTYTITIRNLGENAGDDLSDVLVSEAAGMPGGTWSNAVGFTLPGADANGELVADSFIIPTVATGATLTVGYTVAATGGTLSNTVTVKDDGGTGGNGDTDTNTDVTANVLAISKALAAGQSSVVKMGDTVTYTISAANSGTTALTNVSIDEYMTGTWSNASTGITLPSSGTNLTVPSIGAGETFTVDYTVIADASILVNTVSAFDDEFHFDVDTNGIASAGTLGVSKRPADGQPLVVKKGDPVVYTITIHNTFMGTDLYDVLVTEGMGGGTWSNAVGFALPGADANGSLTADSFIIPTVAADATLTVDYTVAATEGVVTNTITVANDGGNGGYTDTDTNIDITGTPDGGSGGGGDGGGGDTGGGDTGGTGGGGSTLPASGDAATLWLIASALALLVIGTLCVTLNRRAARHRQAEETFHQGLKRHAE